MKKIVDCLGEKFKVRYFFDPDVRKRKVDPKTGESFEMMFGNIEGIEIYSSEGNLLGNFDYVDFDNEEVIKRIIEEYY